MFIVRENGMMGIDLASTQKWNNGYIFGMTYRRTGKTENRVDTTSVGLAHARPNYPAMAVDDVMCLLANIFFICTTTFELI